jgi:hypothetical protein
MLLLVGLTMLVVALPVLVGGGPDILRDLVRVEQTLRPLAPEAPVAQIARDRLDRDSRVL